MMYSLEKGRAYIHKDCGEGTIINDVHFEGLCNPHFPCMGTICTRCDKAFPVKEFIWQDTRENVADYRKRIKSNLAPLWKYWTFISIAMGLGLGSILGAILFRGVYASLAGALIGAGLMFVFGGPQIAKLGSTEFYKIE